MQTQLSQGAHRSGAAARGQMLRGWSPGLATLAVAVLVLLASATAALGASPSPSPSPSSPDTQLIGGELGASEPIFVDDFSDETRWYVGDGDTTAYRYEDGSYVAEVKTDDRTAWSYKTLDKSKPVVHILGTVKPETGRGAAGYLCMAGTGDAAKALFATESTAGYWVLGTISGSDTTVLARGPLSEFTGFTEGGTLTTIALDCGMTTAGEADGTRAILWVDGRRVGEVQTPDVIGPFDRVGVIVGDEDAGFSASFDSLTVLGGDDKAPYLDSIAAGSGTSTTPSESPSASGGPSAQPTTSAEPTGSAEPTQVPSAEPTEVPSAEPTQALDKAQQALLTHVPQARRAECAAGTALPDTPGQVAALQCTSPDGISAWYYQFNSKKNVDAAFDAYTSPKATGKDCQKGPSTITFNLDDKPAGTLACYTLPDTDTVQFEWVNEPLKILAFAQQENGRFADVFDWWRGAGPV